MVKKSQKLTDIYKINIITRPIPLELSRFTKPIDASISFVVWLYPMIFLPFG